jgi:hypothetical protein
VFVNSSVIGKIEKAKRYAQERNRMQFTNLSVTFAGDNDNHEVRFSEEKWHCSCDFFAGYGACAHTMALEKALEGMLPAAAGSAMLQRA